MTTAIASTSSSYSFRGQIDMSDPHFIQQYAAHRISPDDPRASHTHAYGFYDTRSPSVTQHNGMASNGGGLGSEYNSSDSIGFLPTPTSAPLQHHQYQESTYYPSHFHSNPHVISPALSQEPRTFDPQATGAGPSRTNRNGGMMTPVSPATAGEPVFTDGRLGVEDPLSGRKYTKLKNLGDGSFGNVYLCDWHSPVKSDVYLSAMQCGAGAREEWVGKRLVALKVTKKEVEGGWEESSRSPEVASLRDIPPHPAVVALYDVYMNMETQQLNYVFEPMEGNLYQLTKSRRGRPFAAGLMASCAHQITSGLQHIHSHNYFHRDMKPENLLVTTTGITEYLTGPSLNAINAARAGGEEEPTNLQFEKDVTVIVKIADFGLAKNTKQKPPYTEYISTRWYRAPEILMRTGSYGPPVDMWALGTILFEMVNLKPLFPGASEVDQIYRLCGILGDPGTDYGVDERGRRIGGGVWNTGVKRAKADGFSYPKITPVNFRSLFGETVSQSLVDCIQDLVTYNQRIRLTAVQCLEHAYFYEMLPHLQRTPPLPRIPFSQGQPPLQQLRMHTELAIPPRAVPPSHSHHQGPPPAFANGDIRTLPPPVSTPDNMSQDDRVHFPHGHRADTYGASTLVNQLRELDLPTDDLASYGHRPPLNEEAHLVVNPSRDQIPLRMISGQRLQTWLEDPLRQNASTVFDGSVYEGSQSASMSSFANYQSLSTNSLHSREHLPSHSQMPASQSQTSAFVQQQRQEVAGSGEASRHQSTVMLPPPIEPTPNAARPPIVSNPAPIGKKKKWGFSSVFGKDDKESAASRGLPYSSSMSSLKRTPSGHQASDRTAAASVAPPAEMDPKKAKELAKELVKQQRRELELAQRAAQERAQRERARAVMQKREQLIQARQITKASGDIEFGDSYVNIPKATSTSTLQPPILVAALKSQSTQQLANQMKASTSTSAVSLNRQYANMPSSASASATSVRSHDSAQLQRQPPLSTAALQAAQDNLTGDGTESRHKARRKTGDDDHSMSSFGLNDMRSRSVLTVGTIDSDPGPRRVSREAWDTHNPEARRAPSVHSYTTRHPTPRLMSSSNPSLETQLAHDFHLHATVASSSTQSLGRHSGRRGAGHVGVHNEAYLHAGPSPAQGHSVPTSPYGHPQGAAVAQGIGMGRERAIPGLETWVEGQAHGEASPNQPGAQEGQGQYFQINPMFRVPPASNSPRDKPTLPPFSAIASMADLSQQQQPPGQR
ncbi:CMGC/RCK/MAK protein kinase [Tremella mesenterica]|uniref:CMGC/RCK/MAK protein kinase n=1 Tax=Tremella mesenterica TaxID=5217 RepID=A0A4Q1BN03_TREME|nr:CMGC/RCK/MAK protein kinase [Tremella mesenterica]